MPSTNNSVDPYVSELNFTVTVTAPTVTAGTSAANSEQLATAAFVSGAIDALTGGSIKNLNTLRNSATSLGDSPDFIGDMTTKLASKAPIDSPTFTGTVAGITKAMVGLANIDNTSDLLKPISTATQAALNLKANLASPIFTGNVFVNGGSIKTTNSDDVRVFDSAQTLYVGGKSTNIYIGTDNPVTGTKTTVTIGATNDDVNIFGRNLTVSGTTTDTLMLNATDLEVKNKLITLNKGEGDTSVAGAGFNIEGSTEIKSAYIKVYTDPTNPSNPSNLTKFAIKVPSGVEQYIVTKDSDNIITGTLNGNATTATTAAAASGAVLDSALDKFTKASKKAFKSAAIYYMDEAVIFSAANSNRAAIEAYVAAGDAYAAADETVSAKAAYKSAGVNATTLANAANTAGDNATIVNNSVLASQKYTEAGNYYTEAAGYYTAAGETALAATANANAAAARADKTAIAVLVSGNVTANMDTNGMNALSISDSDEGKMYLPFTGMDFYFFGTNYGNSNNLIYQQANNGFGFGTTGPSQTYSPGWPANFPAIIFDHYDAWMYTVHVSPIPQNGTKSSVKYVRIVSTAVDYGRQGISSTKSFETYFVRDAVYQYMLFNCSVEAGSYTPVSDITNGTTFLNTFGTFKNTRPQSGSSYVIRSDLTGNNWTFFQNYKLIL